MKRMVGALGILGLVCAAALPKIANAAATTQMKLFGTTYNVTIFGRDQTYKKADGKHQCFYELCIKPSLLVHLQMSFYGLPYDEQRAKDLEAAAHLREEEGPPPRRSSGDES